VFQHLSEFDGHKLQSLTKEGLKFADEDAEVTKRRTKAYKETFKPLTKFMKELFAGKVHKVAVSQRVEKSPSVIVTSQFGHTANMERLMRAQTFTDEEQVRSMAAQRTLELNPRHPIVVELNKLVVEAPSDESTRDLAYLLYDTALLASGFAQDDTEGFSDRMYRSMASNLNIKSLSLVEEIEDDDEEEEVTDRKKVVDQEEDLGNDEF
jgi:heat shock protein 90kDa beta